MGVSSNRFSGSARTHHAATDSQSGLGLIAAMVDWGALMSDPKPNRPDAIGEAVRSVVQSLVTPLRSEIEELRREIEELRTAGAPRVLSVDQACEQLGVGRTKFYELLAQTDLRDAQVNLPGVSGKRFDRDRLFAWIERHAGVTQRKQLRKSRRPPHSASGLRKPTATRSKP